MDGQQTPLSHTMLQRPPAGGLGAMSAPPPAPMQPPQVSSAQIMQARRENVEAPLQQAGQLGQQVYQQALQHRLMAGLPSAQAMQRAQTARQLTLANAMETLSPEEYSGMDTLTAGITAYKGPTDDANVGAALAGMGRGAFDQREAFKTREMEKALAMQKMTSGAVREDRSALLEADRHAQMMGRGAQGRAGMEFRTLADGTVGVFDRNTGSPMGVFGPRQISKIVELTKTLAHEAMAKGEYQSLEEATAWAQQQAMSMVAQSDEAVGNVNPPQRPGAQSLPPEAAGPKKYQIDENTSIAASAFDAMSPADQESARRVIQRYQANPNSGTRAAMEKELARIGASVPTVGAEQPPAAQPLPTPGMPKKDERSAGFKKAYGEKEAATMEKALTESGELFKANAALIGELNNLEGIFKIANMPEGEFAKGLTTVSSGLKTFGVDVDPTVGPAQAATAIANGMALRMRTAGGSNLMPGAMSNFDAQMLQQMAPNLSQTQDGRMMLIQLMKSAAQSQIRISRAAQDFADKNDGVLTKEWRNEAMKLEKQEMAKRELMRRDIMKKFGATQ